MDKSNLEKWWEKISTELDT